MCYIVLVSLVFSISDILERVNSEATRLKLIFCVAVMVSIPIPWLMHLLPWFPAHPWTTPNTTSIFTHMWTCQKCRLHSDGSSINIIPSRTAVKLIKLSTSLTDTETSQWPLLTTASTGNNSFWLTLIHLTCSLSRWHVSSVTQSIWL